MIRSAFCLTLLLVLPPPPAAAAGPARTGSLPVPANRIVGVWDNAAQVGPCGGPAVDLQRQTLVFHAGGTFQDNPRFPPQGLPNLLGIAGIHQRGIGVGSWRFDPLTRQYTLTQRFDWFVNNAYHGYQVVQRSMLLSGDGDSLSGPVHTVRYAANGSVIAELCGSATSTRL